MTIGKADRAYSDRKKHGLAIRWRLTGDAEDVARRRLLPTPSETSSRHEPWYANVVLSPPYSWKSNDGAPSTCR